jgi:C1A family cysteine protease
VTSHTQRRAASLARPPVDLRSLLTSPVRDQGPRPLCVPFSIAGAHEATRAKFAAPGAEPLAVEPLWQHCLQNGQASHNGTTLAAGSNALEAKGQTVEPCWPYNDTLGAETEPEPVAATQSTWYSATTVDTPLAHDGIEELADDALASGLPLMLVIELTHEFEHPTAQGEIALPALTAPVGDYHAVLAVGAATNAAGTNRRLLIRNSWGSGWGAGGYGWLPLDYLIAFAVQSAAIQPASLAAAQPH